MGDQDDRRRRLAAILSADVAGYSRLMQDDEDATITTLDGYRSVFRERIAARDGRVVDTAGDSVLAVFETATGAVGVADEIQQELARRNESLPDVRRMHFRIGVNLGEVIEKEDGTIYGDGVNIAARLESLAEPGGICVSESAHMQVEGKLDAVFESIGEHAVKNIANPIKAYRLVAEGTAPRRQGHRPVAWAAVAALIFVIAGVAVWQGTKPPPAPPPEVVAEPEDPILALPTGPSIAVLPFTNMSGDPEQDYFSDGLTEDIITGLARSTNLFVIARHSTFRYKGQAIDVRQVGEDLGARYVVEGSVRRDSETVRVTAQLLDASTGAHLWAQTYDRDLTAGGMFEIQDEITQNVVAMIGDAYGVIARAGLEVSQGKTTDDLDAYDCVMRAHEFVRVLTPDKHLKVRECLERVVEADPQYAEAWAWLTEIYVDEYVFGMNPRADQYDARERALETARRAVATDPASANAHLMLAQSNFFLRDLDQFFVEIERTLTLSPNNAYIVATSGLFLCYAGEWDRGVALIEKAAKLNPHHPGWYHIPISWAHNIRGKYEAALAEAQKVNMPGFFWADVVLAIGYQGTGRETEARAAVADLQKSYPGFTLRTLREELSGKWNFRQHEIDNAVSVLRKAGLPEAPPEPTRPVIAVLPFVNLSGDPEQEYFADGITEDIIARLAQFSELLVLARNTTFQFKGQAVDVAEIAKRLGASYVVEGSIRRSGDTIRVNAQLLDSDGMHLWAESYDRELDAANIFAIQDDITSTLATRMGDPFGVIQQDQRTLSRRAAPRRLSSYECVLRYFDYYVAFTPETHLITRDCLEEVVVAEPEYGEAWAYLGDLYIEEVAMGFNVTSESSLKRARATIEKAIILDPGSAPARARLARVLFFTGDEKRAREEAEKAISIAPNSADILGFVAEVFTNTGFEARAKALMDQVVVLNPNYPPYMNWHFGKFNAVNHNYLEAIAWIRKAEWNGWYWTEAYVAALYCLAGELEKGRRALDNALADNPNFAQIFWEEWNMWFEGVEAQTQTDLLTEGLSACGWEVPPGELIDQ